MYVNLLQKLYISHEVVVEGKKKLAFLIFLLPTLYQINTSTLILLKC